MPYLPDTNVPLNTLWLTKVLHALIPGHLHFAYLSLSDHREGRIYMCSAYNSLLDASVRGSYATMNVTRKHAELAG